MSKRKVGVRLLSHKNIKIFIGDSMKTALISLKKIAKESEVEIQSIPDNENNRLVGWYYNIDNLCMIHIDIDNVVDEIKLYNVDEHEIECDKELYSYDNLNEAGFRIIQLKDKKLRCSLDDVDDLLKEFRRINENKDRAIIFGNDTKCKIGFMIKANNNDLTSMDIKKYYKDYPFVDYKQTGIEW